MFHYHIDILVDVVYSNRYDLMIGNQYLTSITISKDISFNTELLFYLNIDIKESSYKISQSISSNYLSFLVEL